MDSRKELMLNRGRLRLKMLSGFNAFPNVKIDDIPEERSLFPNTDNDYWYKVNPTEKDMTSCIYIMDVGSVFKTHIHHHQDEYITLISEGSEVEFIDEENGIQYYKEGDKFIVKKGIAHALVNMSSTPIKFRVDWKPSMNGVWEAEFNQRNQK